MDRRSILLALAGIVLLTNMATFAMTRSLSGNRAEAHLRKAEYAEARAIAALNTVRHMQANEANARAVAESLARDRARRAQKSGEVIQQ